MHWEDVEPRNIELGNGVANEIKTFLRRSNDWILSLVPAEQATMTNDM